MIHPLTSFRFIAALLVFLVHINFLRGYPTLSALYERYFAIGRFGVAFFFVLSGFILAYNYHKIFDTLSLKNAIAYKYYEIPMRNRIRDMLKKVIIRFAVLGRLVNQK